jgi:transposase
MRSASCRSLGRLYASEGRPSIPPEQLLSALLLQVFYGIRSERPLQRFRSSSGLIDQYVCGRAACADSGTPGKSGA